MSVGSAGAERADAGAQRLQHAVDLLWMPGRKRLLNHKRRMREIDELVELRRMQRRHQRAVTHLQQRLADARDACSRFQMADIGLDRTDRAALQGDIVLLERLIQACDLDGIAKFGAGAVRFDITDAARIDIGFFQRCGDDIALCFRVGYRITAVAAAVTDRRAFDDRVDVVAVALRMGQRFEQERANAFARHVAAGAAAKRAAQTFFRQKPTGNGDLLLALMHIKVDAADEGGGAFATLDRIAGEMDRSQAGRTRGVHRNAGAIEVHEIRNAVRDAPEERIGDDFIAGQALLCADHLVHGPHRAHVHADLARTELFTLESFRVVTSVFQRLPGDFQEQAFLRIQCFRFARRNVEEQRIEAVEVVDEAATVSAQGVAIAPAVVTRLGNIGDAVATLSQIFPEFFDITGFRQTGRHADNRNIHAGPARRVVARRRGRSGPDDVRCRRCDGMRVAWRAVVRVACGRMRNARRGQQPVELEFDVEIARALGSGQIGNIDFVRKGADEQIAQRLHFVGLETHWNGQSHQLIERAVLLHAHAVRAGADTRRQIKPCRKRRYRRG